MARKWVNNGFTTFGSALNSSATSLTVKTGEGARFPTADSASGGDDYFYLTLVASAGDLEIVKVTSHSVGSDTMTIVRAQEATTAGSFAIGDVIELRVTAGGLNAFATLDDTQTLTNKTITSPTISSPTISSPTLTGTPVAPTASSGTNTTQLATTAFVTAALGVLGTVPSGAVFYFAASSVPTGYLECDGSAVSRTTYSDLYAVVGDTFGSGDGSTTFNLPDLRGEFIRGYDNGRGKDASRVFGAQQDDAVTEHNHYLARNSSTAAGSSHSGASSLLSGYYNYPIIQSGAAQEGLCGGYVEANASGGCQNMAVGEVYSLDASSSTTTEAETRPTNVALLPCIKT